MIDRPYTLLSCAVSLDGYLDDTTEQRLLLSNDADFDRVDEVRAGCDAILVGANTIRRDNPRLLIRDPARRAARTARGQPPDPIKVTLTVSGDLDPDRQFFTLGDAAKLVYAPAAAAPALRDKLGAAATVLAADDLPAVLADLSARGVRRLMVEGGSTVLTHFLNGDHADELHLAIAPHVVGDPRAPRFLDGAGPAPLKLAGARTLGDVAVLEYLLSATAVDRFWLRVAIDESWRCARSQSAFSVGAVIVDAAGDEISRGYSRENDATIHAEEVAVSKVDADDPRLPRATLYSSLEPCSVRASRLRSCTELIRAVGIPRVVYAWREPALFVDGRGKEELSAAGVAVVEIAELADAARAVNAHLL